MPDDMFFLPDRRALRRGRRISARTETCRPCVIWPVDSPGLRYNGIALDVSPHGMRIRMMDALPEGQSICVQMMRDEDFLVPLTFPMEGSIVRSEPDPDGFLDHGVKLTRPELKREEPRRVVETRMMPSPARPARMYTVDVIVGDRGRSESRRG